MFVHLHGHSHYSLLESIWKPKDIVETAVALWMSSIALTDYNGVYWAIEFFSACKKASIKPIVWVELWFTMDLASKQSHGSIVLIAPTVKEYHNLLRLTSHANMEGYTTAATIDLELLKQYWNGLIAILGWENSYLGYQIHQQQEADKISEQLMLIKSSLWEQGILALELIARDHKDNKKLEEVNQRILEIATANSLDFIISWNFHYVTPDQSQAFETALSIKDGKRIYDEDRRLVTWKRHIQSEEEIRKTMKENWFDDEIIDQGIVMTQTIADKTNLEIELNQLLFPNYQSPEKIKALYEESKDGLVI